MNITKECLKCKQIKPLHKFSKNRSRPDGLYAYCKSCENKRVGEYYRLHKKERKTYRESRKKEIHNYNLNFYNQNRTRERLRARKYHKDNHVIINKKQTHDKHYLRYAYGKYVHRVIAEKILRRKLQRNEVVHHIDGDGLNNDYTNLLICTNGYHAFLHRLIDKKRKYV
jgi:hypothetical protein